MLDESQEELDKELDDAADGPFPLPYVFERESNEWHIPGGFQAVTIPLDGTMNSSLNWQQELELAHAFIKRGYKILLDLNLGLFDTLLLPLTSEMQFQALVLSMEQLKEMMIAFQDHLIGIILFKGMLETIGNDELEYLELLANRLPEYAQAWILLDAAHVTSPLLFAQSCSKERFGRGRLQYALKNPLFPVEAVIWQNGQVDDGFIGRTMPTIGVHQPPRVGVLLPQESHQEAAVAETLQILLSNKIAFKTIPEEYITTEWGGIDILITSGAELSMPTQRKLMGFQAAGGEVIAVLRDETIHNLFV